MEETEHPFARVKMDGERFTGARLPVSSLVELERYQTLIHLAAKQIWKADNPGQVLPDDFGDGFELTLTEVEDGSATSVLERPAGLAYESYYDRGREEFEREMAAAMSSEADVRTIPLLEFDDFKLFGSSLEDEEALKLIDEDETPIFALTRQISEEIIAPLATKFRELQSAQHLVEVPNRTTVRTWITGRLTALDADASNYTIRLKDRNIKGRFKKPELVNDLKKVLDSSAKAPIVRLDAELRFLGDYLEKIRDIHRVQFLEVDGAPWSRRVVELASLPSGWDEDEEGEQVSFAALEAAREILSACQDSGATAPGIYPMHDGGINVEWSSPTSVSSVEISPDAEFTLFSTDREALRVTEIFTKNLKEAVAFSLEVIA